MLFWILIKFKQLVKVCFIHMCISFLWETQIHKKTTKSYLKSINELIYNIFPIGTYTLLGFTSVN